MPLNDNSNGDARRSETPVYEPILHKPGKDYSLIRNIGLALVILVTVAGVVYFTYREWLRSNSEVPRQEISLGSDLDGLAAGDGPIADGPGPSGGPAGGQVEVDVKDELVSAPVKSDEQAVQSEDAGDRSLLKDDGSGSFTIYVASLAEMGDANSALHRWTAEGFSGRIVEARGRYRVAIGRFRSESSARKFVSDNRARFGNDFWISKTPR